MNSVRPKLMSRAALALLVGGAALLWERRRPLPRGSFISQRGGADRAAGDAHELCRRGAANHAQELSPYGAAAGRRGWAYYYAAPGCAQVVNSYGQIVYRCP